MKNQGEFSFDGGAAGDGGGYSRWMTARKTALEELARKLDLPLNHLVEVWLVGNVRLRGTLRLQEEMLFVDDDRVPHLTLQVDHVAFKVNEMESCVRLD